jgi:hypothetical protein
MIINNKKIFVSNKILSSEIETEMNIKNINDDKKIIILAFLLI